MGKCEFVENKNNSYPSSDETFIMSVSSPQCKFSSEEETREEEGK